MFHGIRISQKATKECTNNYKNISHVLIAPVYFTHPKMAKYPPTNTFPTKLALSLLLVISSISVVVVIFGGSIDPQSVRLF